MDEFILTTYFRRLLSLWWVAIITTLTGVTIGIFFTTNHPPVYEGTAVFPVNLDMEKGQKILLTEYDKDLALSNVLNGILYPEVTKDVVSEANQLGIPLTMDYLKYHHAIERRFESWEVRFRSPDPLTAQIVTNLWAELAYERIINLQADGKIPAYVLFTPPILSEIPEEPVRYPRTHPIVAGAVLGLVVGILLSEGTARIKTQKSESKIQQEA
jgi:uncharacterized membrane-anchored protein YhcB (DUF1043 family)